MAVPYMVLFRWRIIIIIIIIIFLVPSADISWIPCVRTLKRKSALNVELQGV